MNTFLQLTIWAIFSFSNSGQGGKASKRPKTTKEAAGHEETDSGKYIVHCY